MNIVCIGNDTKLHFCNPASDKTLCDINVKSKKIGKLDNSFKRFFCGECDAKNDNELLKNEKSVDITQN